MLSLSAESATREGAIEAARDTYGPSVRITGIRRVRSGGVMGFFSAERFVAEVDLPDDDDDVRPARTAGGAIPRTTLPRPAPAARPAAPDLARTPRGTWVDEDGEEWVDDWVPSRPTAGARAAAPRPASSAVRAAGAPAQRSTAARVDELADLLGGGSDAPAAGLYSRRSQGTPGRSAATPPRTPGVPAPRSRSTGPAPAGFPRVTAREGTARDTAPRDGSGRPARSGSTASGRGTAAHTPPRSAAAAPVLSPFAAALARMVDNDDQVRGAAAEALRGDELLPPLAGPTGAGPLVDELSDGLDHELSDGLDHELSDGLDHDLDHDLAVDPELDDAAVAALEIDGWDPVPAPSGRGWAAAAAVVPDPAGVPTDLPVDAPVQPVAVAALPVVPAPAAVSPADPSSVAPSPADLLPAGLSPAGPVPADGSPVDFPPVGPVPAAGPLADPSPAGAPVDPVTGPVLGHPVGGGAPVTDTPATPVEAPAAPTPTATPQAAGPDTATPWARTPADAPGGATSAADAFAAALAGDTSAAVAPARGTPEKPRSKQAAKARTKTKARARSAGKATTPALIATPVAMAEITVPPVAAEPVAPDVSPVAPAGETARASWETPVVLDVAAPPVDVELPDTAAEPAGRHGAGRHRSADPDLSGQPAAVASSDLDLWAAPAAFPDPADADCWPALELPSWVDPDTRRALESSWAELAPATVAPELPAPGRAQPAALPSSPATDPDAEFPIWAAIRDTAPDDEESPIWAAIRSAHAARSTEPSPATPIAPALDLSAAVTPWTPTNPWEASTSWSPSVDVPAEPVAVPRGRHRLDEDVSAAAVAVPDISHWDLDEPVRPVMSAEAVRLAFAAHDLGGHEVLSGLLAEPDDDGLVTGCPERDAAVHEPAEVVTTHDLTALGLPWTGAFTEVTQTQITHAGIRTTSHTQTVHTQVHSEVSWTAPATPARDDVEQLVVEAEPAAADPAPWPTDATMVMPPLSMLPPRRVPPAGALRPPVLPRRALPATPPAARSVTVPAATRTLALPTATTGELTRVPAPAARLAAVTQLVTRRQQSLVDRTSQLLVDRLRALGMPGFLLDAEFAAAATAHGTYSALASVLSAHLPTPPGVPTGPGDVLLLIGPGSEALTAARAVATAQRLDHERIQWATPGELACLTPESMRVTSTETAIERRRWTRAAGTVTIVAVDAPLRGRPSTWVEQMLGAWSPTAVWGVLDATRKPEDLTQWLTCLPRVDAVALAGTDASADPAAMLQHVPAPVALLDGVPATAHRWASLLCERLEGMHR